MTDQIDRAEIYAAMAAAEAEEQATRAARNPFIKNSARTVSVSTPDGKVAEVPSPDYVRELERTVRAQAEVIAKLERQMNRFSATLRTYRHTINLHTGRINDVNRELDQKIDRRD